MLPPRKDFVDREQTLSELQSNLLVAQKTRLVIVHAKEGMGKTALLSKFGYECQNLLCKIAYVDLPGRSYLHVIDQIANQLGPDEFGELDHELVSLPEQVAVNATAQAVGKTAVSSQESGPSTLPKPDPGKFEFKQQASFHNSQLAAGNIFNNPHFTSVYHIHMKDEESVMQYMQGVLTRQLLKGLSKVSAVTPCLVMFDHWQANDSEVQKWLKESLIHPNLTAPQTNLQFVAVCEEPLPIYDQLVGVMSMEVPLLPVEAVKEFWVDHHHLPTTYYDNPYLLDFLRMPSHLKDYAEYAKNDMKNRAKSDE